MSLSTTKSSPSLIRPIAMPPICFLIGTPAAIKARDEPHTVAIELEPLDSVISDTNLRVYGKSSFFGNIG